MLSKGLLHFCVRLRDLVPHALYESLCLLELFFRLLQLFIQVNYRGVESVNFRLEICLNSLLALDLSIVSRLYLLNSFRMLLLFPCHLIIELFIQLLRFMFMLLLQ